MSKVVQQIGSDIGSMRAAAQVVLDYANTMDNSLIQIKATVLMQKIDALEVTLISTLQNYKDAQ